MAMPCCCKSGRSKKANTSCLGRCDLPRHRCLDQDEIKPGPVPKHMGWLFNARDSPEHQLRCGWRPGHISCPVLRRIEHHHSMQMADCATCTCARCCKKGCTIPSTCVAICPPRPSQICKQAASEQPLIRIIRHAGQYTIETKPSNIDNSPYGPYPLKYVLNTDEEDTSGKKAKYSLEAKFNDYLFDYTSSQDSFILDFSPPEQKCFK